MLTYYIDMDGVLVNFFKEPDAVKRCTTEEGFFAKLEPITENVKALKEFIATGGDYYICSNSPNNEGDKGKREWLKTYLPEIPTERIIFTRSYNKKKYMVTAYGILLDDSERNCKSWTVKKGNVAFRVTDTIGQYLN